ncbi:hypothetical protein NIES2135_54130 [Leptolyngbya boryana NIES-2135]|jgi:hypothetical protein|uniref:DUF2688 domain-containing protein n=1 Tax=Leptolyngbya boryana NIES-2135 TaxID=1973484 RepID=A0A1Z4JPA6_LEPBY|nr:MULTISPECIES: DUF2688 domain-containing protein [Leptolyngbya]BAY58540.1 hypothetical protein NIES2135_54130 [Leptolyngbya boryana NIES-2135]MBD2370781.1 DUF2688 domain-containing protein [Leptolyngbya sp. FACHB-161]MBD2377066.1 DUF2688 domain-containing protein [Leptolyngbya sp. FACHB-238]MBD2401509.1 DUF2688 domain-containing protein [Leptolyngbya sp. FACHB-239]MBD2408061.1 DUF2688 domain-containing protein [Leptolyngbya sp. FACHB-402]
MVRRRKKIEVIHTPCKRCGCDLVTTSRSIHGADVLKAELGSICERCITPEERERILHGIANQILS